MDLPTGTSALLLGSAYACLVCVAVIHLVRARRLAGLRRHPAPPAAGRVLDIWEIALLVDGPTRLAQVTIVHMLGRGRAVIGKDHSIGLLAAEPEDEYERMVFDAVGPQRTAPVESVVARIAESTPTAGWRPTWARLERDGLLLPEGAAERGARTMTNLMGIGFVLTFVSLAVGYIGPLTIGYFLLWPAVGFVFLRPFAPQTTVGRAWVTALRTDTPAYVPTRVAVFGPREIPDRLARAALTPPRPSPID
ncbi:TIGR04222 domain-containing membrane protein [Embleya sp. AB8]|uniref:TIGR04222 domain-containing membrane protein n=1 Tax=Embleya sp. AB8 TaxID=3156304 RepID=UPI003C74B58B